MTTPNPGWAAKAPQAGAGAAVRTGRLLREPRGTKLPRVSCDPAGGRQVRTDGCGGDGGYVWVDRESAGHRHLLGINRARTGWCHLECGVGR